MRARVVEECMCTASVTGRGFTRRPQVRNLPCLREVHFEGASPAAAPRASGVSPPAASRAVGPRPKGKFAHRGPAGRRGPRSARSPGTHAPRSRGPPPDSAVDPREVKAAQNRGEKVVFLDVRGAEAWSASDRRIPGAIRMTLDDLERRLSEVPRDAEVVAYCT